MIIFVSDNPEAIIDQQRAHLLASNTSTSAFAIQFTFTPFYIPQPQSTVLIALIHLTKKNSSVAVAAAIFSADKTLLENIAGLGEELEALQNFARERCQPWLELSAPLVLAPVKIPKPWGQEIWYTGMEIRGQSGITAGGFTTLLPWVLALMPRHFAAGLDKKITLLKTLDPLPAEVYGDLYFELHEQKQEVYVVTHIDSSAWENEVGQIRLGFNSDKRRGFDSDRSFKAAYLAAVEDYEKIRRTIDNFMDEKRVHLGVALDVPVDVSTSLAWSQLLPKILVDQEQQARAYMNSFTATQALQVGDVIKVPCFVPHALQHGVRTLEFQTPVYERKILSFAQKVLTQRHWDTRDALEHIQLDVPVQEPFTVLFDRDGVVVEEIVKFDDFRVNRIHLAAFQRHPLTRTESYGLVMPINGECSIIYEGGELNLSSEVASFIPHALLSNTESPLAVEAKGEAVQVLVATAV